MVRQARQRRRPVRSCVACGRAADKRELVRVVRGPDGSVAVDPTGKRSGRGAYLCRDVACLEGALKGGRLERGLELSGPLDEAVVAVLRTTIDVSGGGARA
jgi:predicted RNA-binding protein YlxR (DUF448 family)